MSVLLSVPRVVIPRVGASGFLSASAVVPIVDFQGNPAGYGPSNSPGGIFYGLDPFPYIFGDVFWFSTIPPGFTLIPQPGGSFSVAVAFGTAPGVYAVGWTVQDTIGNRTFGTVAITATGAIIPPPPPGSIDIGGSGTQQNRITPSFHGHEYIPSAGFYWYDLLRTANVLPVDPRSDNLIARIGPRNIHMDFFGDTGPTIYGIPINVVRGDTTRVTVSIGSYDSESDHVPVPIPTTQLSIEGWYTIGALPTFAEMNDGADHHLLITVRDETTGAPMELFELAQPWYDGAWHCAQLSYWSLITGGMRPDGWTSSDAAGLPRMPFMARYEETLTVDGIRHPLAVTFSEGNIRNRYIYPARHAALNGSNDDGIPFGAVLRMRLDWYTANQASFTGAARSFVEAMRIYGMINCDIGGMLFLTGTSDSRWDNANLMTLQNIPATAFEVVQMTPAFELTGPATVAAGSQTQYTIVTKPPVDPTAKGFYINVFTNAGVFVPNGVTPDHLSPKDGIVTTTFTAPFATGRYWIQVDQAGEYKFPWIVEGVRGYPELAVDVI